ncbi:DNA-formamidopyrimidine glycosylase [Natribacillus halophilus]|uniref:Formamidopyrimidine-DNA glycosylase n=1 Tax=Natribacillus halophilus TaxID=549003 RepID=A0A1G8RY62_9BACI|nr:DNA-formamidopyrimidine glycosylase [Natribacillus halophilus]SDJ21893.1 DNA-(apurinic or apyrimidinic site) lyase [Natribacillus halophilus]
MPELPEVETVRKTLVQLVQDRQIVDSEVSWPRMIKKPDDVEAFRFLLAGQTIRNISRKGKFLIFNLDDYALVSHLRMEGKYSIGGGEADKHTHVRFFLDDHRELHYRDVRKFGTMHLFPAGTEYDVAPLAKLGPEPMEGSFTPEYLQRIFAKTTRNVKAVLLDQAAVAGLGNIYVDEALFRAGIFPGIAAASLDRRAVARVHRETIETLGAAIEAGGTSIRSYLNGNGEMGYFQQQLYVYGSKGHPCKRCGSEIERAVVAGRGTHYCPSCQCS